MKKVYYQTFGCRTNREETVAYEATFKKLGYTTVESADEADIIIVNSCSVTAQTESKVRRFVQSLSQKYPKAEIALTGCLAQQTVEDAQRWQGVNWVIGNDQKGQIDKIITDGNGGVYAEKLTKDSAIASFATIESPLTASRTRFSLKIQEGCDMICTYCIVPSLRGPSRSIPFDQVLSDAGRAVEAGYHELVITGTHIGQYRDGSKSYIDILKAILDAHPKVRLRLSSMNPKDCNEDLIDLFKSEERLCRHLHVSVQSLDEETLKAMKRPAKATLNLKETLKKLKSEIPTLSIGGDFIVGFPGETDSQFNNTLNSIDEFGFNYGHVFRYSQRPGTPAAEMQNQIHGSVMKERSEALREKLSICEERFIKSLVGCEETIIIETEGRLKGITGNYISIDLPSESPCLKNDFKGIKITAIDGKKVIASPLT